jgi:hypothetical protein
MPRGPIALRYRFHRRSAFHRGATIRFDGGIRPSLIAAEPKRRTTCKHGCLGAAQWETTYDAI